MMNHTLAASALSFVQFQCVNRGECQTNNWNIQGKYFYMVVNYQNINMYTDGAADVLLVVFM